MDDLISRQAAYEVLTDYYHHRTDGQHETLKEALGRVPSVGDVISRQAAIECLWKHMDNAREFDEWTVVMELERVRKDIDNMPAAEPRRGKWVDCSFYGSVSYICDACAKVVFQTSGYCPNCGARMEESDGQT